MPTVIKDFVPDAADRTAASDWDRARAAKVTLLEYAFAPAEIVFREGASYRLVLTNVGDFDHYFTAPDFFWSIAVRGVELVPIGQPEWADVSALRRQTPVAYRAGPEALRVTFKVAPLSAPAADYEADEPDNPFAATSDEEDGDDADKAGQQDEDSGESEEGTESIFKFEQDDRQEPVSAAPLGQPDDTATLAAGRAETSGDEKPAPAEAAERDEPTFLSAAADGGNKVETRQAPARGPARADAERPTAESNAKPPAAVAPAPLGDDSDIETFLRALGFEDDDSVHGIAGESPAAASATAEAQPAAPAVVEPDAPPRGPAAEATADDGAAKLPTGAEAFLRAIAPPAETEDEANLATEDRRPAEPTPDVAEQPAKADAADETLAAEDRRPDAADLPGQGQRPAPSAQDVTADQDEEQAEEPAATAEAAGDGVAETAESVEEVVEEAVEEAEELVAEELVAEELVAEELVAEELTAEQAEDAKEPEQPGLGVADVGAQEPEQPGLGVADVGAQPSERQGAESKAAVVAKPSPRLAAILVPARHSKVLYFVAVRTGSYPLRSFAGADDILGMRGRIIIE